MNEVKFKANIADLLAVQAEVEAIPEIPAPAAADSGKVLTVTVDSSGETPVAEYGLATPASELPAIGSSDAGKVLTVNNAHTGVEWKAADALPAIASGDAGKVLTVNAGETAAEWAAASGGGLTSVLENNLYLRDTEFNNCAHAGIYDYQGSTFTVTDSKKAWIGAFYASRYAYESISGTKNGQTVSKQFALIPYLERSSNTEVKTHLLMLCVNGEDSDWSTNTSTIYFKFYVISET